MTRIAGVLVGAACIASGLLVGAWLLEAAVLVPLWRSMLAADFHALYAGMHGLLYRFFTPVTVAPLVLSLAAAAASFATGARGRFVSAGAAALLVGLVATHEIYFKGANDLFAAGTLGADALAAELARWRSWHLARTGVGLVVVVMQAAAMREGAVPRGGLNDGPR